MSLYLIGYLMDLLTQLMMGSIEFHAKQVRITDLDYDCFQQIFKYLSLSDLFMCRAVNKYFLKMIDQFLETKRLLIYNCELNGIRMQNGEYVFNWIAFDFVLSKMPNIRVLKFEKSFEMLQALATTGYNIIESMAYNLIMLNELHISRCRALNRSSLELLVDSFPNLTHLTISIYNESFVGIITKGLSNLKYFNLDQSCLIDYGEHLKDFGYKIHTFIAAPDYNDYKYSIIDNLIKGNGRYLKRLELKIKVFDYDYNIFNEIGEQLNDLQWFECHIDSKRISSNHSLLSGLRKLSNLKVLRLEENLILDEMRSVIDDHSLLLIMKGCSQLEQLTLISGKNSQTLSKYITDSSLSLIDQLLPNLKVLLLKSVHITDQTLDSIGRLNKLETLRLDSLPFVTDCGLKNLMANSSHITRMDAHNCTQNIIIQQMY